MSEAGRPLEAKVGRRPLGGGGGGGHYDLCSNCDVHSKAQQTSVNCTGALLPGRGQSSTYSPRSDVSGTPKIRSEGQSSLQHRKENNERPAPPDGTGTLLTAELYSSTI